MTAGAVLFIWIGFSQNQTLAVDHFATMAECKAAQAAIVARWDDRVEGGV